MSLSMEELERRKRELAAALRDNRLRQKRARRAREVEARQWVLTEEMRRVALSIFMLTEYATEPVVKYLQTCARMRHWPPKEDTAVAEMVDQLFLASDMDEAAALSDTAEPLDEAVLMTALKHADQWNVVQWCKLQNEMHGTAPSSQAMLDKLEQRRLQTPVQSRSASMGTTALSRGRAWARRLRLRWSGRFKAIPAGERVSTVDLVAKAAGAEIATLMAENRGTVDRRNGTEIHAAMRRSVGSCLAVLFWMPLGGSPAGPYCGTQFYVA